MSTLIFALNVFFTWFFHHQLMNVDYTDKKWQWYLDGSFFALNFANVLMFIF